MIYNVSLHHSCRDTERNKEIAFLEGQVYEYVEVLGVSPESAGYLSREGSRLWFNGCLSPWSVLSGAEAADS